MPWPHHSPALTAPQELVRQHFSNANLRHFGWLDVQQSDDVGEGLYDPPASRQQLPKRRQGATATDPGWRIHRGFCDVCDERFQPHARQSGERGFGAPGETRIIKIRKTNLECPLESTNLVAQGRAPTWLQVGLERLIEGGLS